MTLGQWLDNKVGTYNHPSFIVSDPVSVPHQFSFMQDIEIAGLFAAILAWGQRPTIIKKSNELLSLMDGAPHQFVTQHHEKDRKRFLSFKHRTFQPDDIIYLLEVLQRYYRSHQSLEDAFAMKISPDDKDVFNGLANFHDILFDHPWVMERTRKHISTPVRKSACKRINMYLRWMVRQDEKGVDFGLWKKISPSQLIIPLDLHVGNVARKLGLLERKINDWQAAKELTDRLREFDRLDPVKYDFALFGVGINDDFDFL